MSVVAATIAFHAPLKPPAHATPSGDRRMARLLLAALDVAGYRVDVATAFRSYCAVPDPAMLSALAAAGAREADRLIARWSKAGVSRPDLWLTYHLHYKAPDWIGPAVADALGIPYVVVEASHAPKRLTGPWADNAAAVVAALSRADAVLVMTAHDRPCVADIVPAERLWLFPPFLDVRDDVPDRRGRPAGSTRLLSVAMMRPGDKLESYRYLALALAQITDLGWHLDVAGDGPARLEVEAAFAALPSARVTFHGALDTPALARLRAAADLYAWPGVGEAYGMAYLEAAASGLASVAERSRGVPDVVIDGRTGILTAPGDADAYAGAVAALITDPARRRALGEGAARFARTERDLAGAARRLRDILRALLP